MMLNRTVLCTAAAALTLVVSERGTAQRADTVEPTRRDLARRIDSLLVDAVASNRLASVSVAVVRGSDTIVLRAAGLAQRETARAANAETVYRLGSITKQFTSSIILQLVAEGKLALSDTAGRFFPWIPAAWRAVPVAMLLNHTSGIPSYTNLGPVWSRRAQEDMTPDTLIALTTSKPLDFPSGTAWRYDNTGYVMLGAIIERIESKPYAEVVQTRLARPLGLSTLRYCPTDPDPARDAFPYDNAPGRTFVPSAKLSLTQPHAAGALCSTARDLVKWNVALHGGRVVRPDLYARMTTPEGAAVRNGYGYGISRDTSGGTLRLAHGGGINGFITSNSYTPSQRLSIVVLGNTASGEVDRLAAQIAMLVDGKSLVPRPTVVSLTAAQLAMHVGRYELALPGRSLPFTVSTASDGLVLRFEGQPTPSHALPIGPHRFVDENDDSAVFEFTLEGERVTGMVFIQGQRLIAKRLPD